MTREEFFDAVSGIDPVLIERTDKERIKRKPIFKIAAVAAAFVLMLGAVGLIMPKFTGVPITEDKIVWKNIFDPERWDPMSVFSGKVNSARIYYNYEYDDPQYGEFWRGGIVEEEIGAYIGQTKVRVSMTTEIPKETVDLGTHVVEFFEIVGIPRDIAIAYKYEDDGKFSFVDDNGEFLYMWNTEYEFNTLSEIYGYFDTVYVGADVVRYESSPVFKWSFKNTDTYLVTELADSEHIPEILLSVDGDVKVDGMYNAFDSEAFKEMREYLKVSVVIRELGTSAMYYITDNGYVVVELADKMYFVNVGKEKAAQLTADITAPMKLYVPPQPSRNNGNSSNDETAVIESFPIAP